MKLLYHILIITLMTAPLAQAQSFWDQYSEKVFKAGVGLCLVPDWCNEW
ncbi:MAG: hypothetical protein M1114_02370 [Candidatus Dependentiae bacterium]|nr:hypothetical protein [Candidatus Dependentiae bacterium]